MKKTVVALVLGLVYSCGAFALDGELWEARVLQGPPGMPGTGKPQRICQKPAGEFEMADLGAMPPGCKMNQMKRNGPATTFDFQCDGARMNGMKMSGHVVSERLDTDTILQTVDIKMGPSTPILTIKAKGTRVGSCKLPGSVK